MWICLLRMVNKLFKSGIIWFFLISWVATNKFYFWALIDWHNVVLWIADVLWISLCGQPTDNGQAFGWTDRQTIRHWMDRLSVMDRPSGERTDHQETSINRQTIGRWTDLQVTDRPYIVLSTNRPLGDGQIYGWQTDRSLYSNVTHFSKLTPFFCQKKILSCRGKSIKKHKENQYGCK